MCADKSFCLNCPAIPLETFLTSSLRNLISPTMKPTDILRKFLNFWKLTGHSQIIFNPETNNFLLKNSKFSKLNDFLLFYYVIYHITQTIRCFYKYQDKVMGLVALAWVMGYSMGTFGNGLNSILKRNERIVMVNNVFKLQRFAFGNTDKPENQKIN